MVMLTIGVPLDAAGVVCITNVVDPVTVTGSALLCDVFVYASPAYTAMIECVPTNRPELLIFADPLDTVTGLPSKWLVSTTPSYSCTCPFGFPPVTFTVNVNVFWGVLNATLSGAATVIVVVVTTGPLLLPPP
jgi:hypothetical protein